MRTTVAAIVAASVLAAGCATKTHSYYEGAGASTISTSDGTAVVGWMANALAGFGCHVREVDGVYGGLNERVTVEPGLRVVDISWLKVEPSGNYEDTVWGNRILVIDIAPDTDYVVNCTAHRTTSGYSASFYLDDREQHRFAWCDKGDEECIAGAKSDIETTD